MSPTTTPAPVHVIALLGLSPAVVTELVFALLQRGRRPARLVVVGTRNAAERLLQRWGALCPELEPQLQLDQWAACVLRRTLELMALDHPALGVPHDLPIEVLLARDAMGAPLDDLADTEQVDAFLETCWAAVQQGVRAPEPVVASLAGGRKSMSAALQQCMNLLSRPRDQLVHVLISPEFERPWFLYPRQMHLISALAEARDPLADDGDNVPVRLRLGIGAEVSLYDLTLFRLRRHLVGFDPAQDLEGALSSLPPAEAPLDLGQVRIELDLRVPCVRLDGHELQLHGDTFWRVARWLWLVMVRRLEGHGRRAPHPCTGCAQCQLSIGGLKELAGELMMLEAPTTTLPTLVQQLGPWAEAFAEWSEEAGHEKPGWDLPIALLRPSVWSQPRAFKQVTRLLRQGNGIPQHADEIETLQKPIHQAMHLRSRAQKHWAEAIRRWGRERALPEERVQAVLDGTRLYIRRADPLLRVHPEHLSLTPLVPEAAPLVPETD